jgi:hypothetical protein
MNNAEIRMTGVGCFAGGTTLSRVLRRMMDAYSLGDWSQAQNVQQDSSPAVQALQKLLSAGSRSTLSADGPPTVEDVAGFFLNFDNERLNLSVFTRGRGRRCQKFTASLEDLTRLRQSRLH